MAAIRTRQWKRALFIWLLLKRGKKLIKLQEVVEVTLDREKEKEIINKVLGGDRNAFAVLVDAYQGRIFSFIRRLSGAGFSDCEDIAQETFVRAYKGLATYDSCRPLPPWLYTIARNLVKNFFESRGNEFFLFDDTTGGRLQESKPGPESELTFKSEQEYLLKLVGKLPFNQRDAVILRYMEELSYGEIAEVLAISESAAKMRVARGIENLQRLIEER
jgi:RNA polymerase sigma-70 factor (ECF subfamily)